MACPIHVLVIPSQKSGIRSAAIWLGSVVLLMAAMHVDARGTAIEGQEKERPNLCSTPELDSGSNDMQSLKAYGAGLRQLLQKENFKELNCIADSARSSKGRLPGGMWKIHEFYVAVNEMQGHSTQEDWNDHLKLLEKWVAATPSSITAQVALARANIDYAWYARGNGMGDTVTDSGWRLFAERLDKAKSILDEAANLPGKDPEWYFSMQVVALGQGWDRAKADDLLKHALASEPDYYYYYRYMAYYLMPQWNGENGDAAKFAEESANRVGGDAGDILYFQIGTKIVCACDDPEFGRLSWPRLQKGYALLEKQHGVALLNLNWLALMATKSVDSVVADNAFKRIGDNWDKDTWRTEEYFTQNKTWAAQMAPAEARSRGILQEAATNLQSPGGAQYQKNMEQALVPLMRQCAQDPNSDQAKFELVVKIGKDGGAEDAWPRQFTATAQCIMRQIYESHIKKETPFPAPPRPDYWVDLQLDPATISTTAAN
jgi:hypothetical protein